VVLRIKIQSKNGRKNPLELSVGKINRNFVQCSRNNATVFRFYKGVFKIIVLNLYAIIP